eukprot:TRINITY_DN771_c12_g1_i1.p1 TRINITY_DN771_c12_g1~~TRINITY_DN771_c12_g1_i1.p1  ORF type:complete len:555 (+),score=98.96 TRINITY_DN771_c12_g1_i1:56-1666(+)
MKFGERLIAETKDFGLTDAELEKGVLAYSNLKRTLKLCVNNVEGEGTKAADSNDVFWKELEAEIEKIDRFYCKRLNKLQDRLSGMTRVATLDETEMLQKDLTALQKWVELNHIALVKIYKKYVKNMSSRQSHGYRGDELPVLFKRAFFEDDSELVRMSNKVNSVVAILKAKSRCALCAGTAPCANEECVNLNGLITDSCHSMVPGWKGKDLAISVLTGGLSNKLYTVEAVEVPEGQCRKVVVRILGSGDLVDRDIESVVVRALSEINVGPKLFGSFDGGRIEEFSNGLALRFYHLNKPQVLSEVSKKIADFHNMSIPGIPCEPGLFKILRGYLKSAMKVSFTHETQDVPGTTPVLKKDLLAQMDDLAALEGEISYLEGEVKKFTVSGVSFCHCDVQEGNILTDNLHSSTPAITLIDFEYSRYDYEAFDIANFFCETYLDNFFPEYPGYRCHPQLLLSPGLQTDFITSYLTTKTGSVPSAVTVQQFYQECQVMILAAHLHWCLWSLIQAAASDIEGFCYLSYAVMRLREYRRLKPLS